ncbi:13696_t:CDS:2, partial [Racocetra persica]
SFRSHQEIIAVANDFSQNFLGAWHYTDLKSRKAGEKPVVFLSEDSQKQIDFVVEQIDQIQEPARKAILYYQNKTGKKIAEELRKRNIDFIGLKDKDNEGARIIERLKFLKVEEKAGDKLTPFQAKRFIQELEDFTFHRFLVNNPKDKVGRIILSTIHGSKGLEFDHVFLVDVNEEILPGKNINNAEEELEKARIFYVGVTRAKKKLYLCSSDREEISQFLLKIDPKLVEIRTSKVDFLKTTSSPSAQKKEEIIGVEGEEKVYDLLVESQIPFL